MQSASSCWRVYSHRPSAQRAQTIWTGPTTTFAKLNFADWTLPQNQDRLTGNVWITRGNSHGIFNIAIGQETGYVHDVSPKGTQWAYGTAQNWQSLSFAAWELWAASNPPGTIGQDAVLHLVQDDVYLDIKFLSWTGSAGGGGFSYQRSSPEMLAGDANGDRAVNDTDASIVGAHWMSTGAVGRRRLQRRQRRERPRRRDFGGPLGADGRRAGQRARTDLGGAFARRRVVASGVAPSIGLDRRKRTVLVRAPLEEYDGTGK